MDAEGARWTLDRQLTARLIEGVEWGNWQRAGKRGAKKPEPIRRPGVGPTRTQLSESQIVERIKALRDREARGG